MKLRYTWTRRYQGKWYNYTTMFICYDVMLNVWHHLLQYRDRG